MNYWKEKYNATNLKVEDLNKKLSIVANYKIDSNSSNNTASNVNLLNIRPKQAFKFQKLIRR